MTHTSANSTEQARVLRCELEWDGDLRFTGQSANARLVLDSAGQSGPSPMQALAFALAGCMGMDVVHFLNRARVPATAVRLSLEGRRASGDPGRFVAISLHVVIESAASEEQAARAIRLSREKYCSVWNSMSQDIGFDVSFTVNPPPGAEAGRGARRNPSADDE